LVAHFEGGRRRWLDALVTRIVDSRVAGTFENNGAALSPTEKALLVTHVGLSHIYGIAESDIAVQGFLSEQEVVGLLSRHWRDGHFDVRLASSLEELWACLYRLGVDTRAVRPELAGALFKSQLGRRMQAETAHRLKPNVVDTDVLTYLAANPVTPSNLESFGSFALAFQGSHLPIVHALLAEQGLEAARLVTSLELAACVPDNMRTAWNEEALRTASRQHLMYQSIVGGWPGPGRDDIPDWVRDAVAVAGARMFYASVGFVPGWLIVAESEDELNAIRRWTYNTHSSFFAGENDSGALVVGFDMTLPSDGESVQASWLYSLDDALSLSRLKTMVAIGLIRIDIYRISADAQLEYVHSFGCALPTELTDTLREHLVEHELPQEEVRRFSPMTTQERLLTMAQIEQHAFESLHHSLCADPLSKLGTTFRHYLEVVDATTAATFKGYPADLQAHQAAREALRLAIGTSGRRTIEPIDLGRLGRDRAYAQFRFAQDAPTQLVADVAYLDQHGEIAVESHEFAGAFNASWSVERQSEALARGFHELRRLIELGVCKIVVNAHSVTYNLPYHEALLRIGFTEASYSHRAGTLNGRGTSKSTSAVVIGYAGEGPRHIKAVDTELKFVKELYATTVAELALGKLPATVHLSGHGHAGSKNYEVGIEIDAKGPPLSSAQVLMDLDANDTDLVYLSACSTGSGSYGPLQLVDTVPLDVAFIEKGARAVLSTSAPVNDSVACFFACIFHHARSMGDAIWDAYDLAREATKKQDLPQNRPHLGDMVDRIWPEWRTDLAAGAASAPDDWQLFRLSGRHWEGEESRSATAPERV
jgi:hypothetical protein